jgi:FecR protein
MKTRRLSWIGFAVFGLLFTLQSPRTSFAQEQDDQDPPTRVARLNYSSGSVSFQPSGEGDWVTAVPNRPLTTGDNLWADQNSRAELHIGSTAIRMNSETSLTFLDLDDQNTQLRLSLGSLLLRVRHLDDGDLLEVDTPNLAFTIQRTGEYRIDVNADGNQTITTVWRGRGEATGGGYSYTVVAGQQATFNGTDELDHEIAQIPGNDDFVDWAFQRDTREDRAESSNYISSEMTGYEDLDDYGHWRYVADYGPVWTPIGVAPGWAPYRFGHWIWVAPWGWTWVEDEPWGFAPFHYGRWAYVENGWCWVPGPVYVRPVYAPALVAFVGGGGFHLSIGVGEGVAWFPLGPREVYVPPYRVSRTYVNNVNITNTRVNVTQVTNVYNNYTTNNVTKITYVNQRVPTAVTAVSHETFVNARPVAKNLAQVDARQIAEAPVSHIVPVQPERTSVVGAGTAARARPPAAIENRHVVATRNPTPPRAPFEQRQATNVRTETPGQPAPRPEAPRPEAPIVKTQPDEHRNIPRPSAPGRPEEPPQVSRQPEVPRSEMPRAEPQPAPHPAQGYQNRGSEAPTHPLVRPAPPVQSRPQVEQNEANKFRNWQQQRPSPPPANVPRPPENRPPQKEERKK